jgi:hypothetical protein
VLHDGRHSLHVWHLKADADCAPDGDGAGGRKRQRDADPLETVNQALDRCLSLAATQGARKGDDEDGGLANAYHALAAGRRRGLVVVVPDVEGVVDAVALKADFARLRLLCEFIAVVD